MFRPLRAAACRRARRVNVLTPAFREDLLERRLVSPDKVCFIPNGADLDLFQPGPRDNAFRRKMGWEDRFVVLYNKRFGDQSVQMCLVRATSGSWEIEFEGMLFDGQARLELTDEVSSQEQIGLIQFGYPMGVYLNEQTLLIVHWCAEDGVCGIRWTRVRLGW